MKLLSTGRSYRLKGLPLLINFQTRAGTWSNLGYITPPKCFAVFLSISEETAWENILKQTTIPPVGFEVLTPVVMNTTIFCNITPCSPLKIKKRFGETYRLNLQGRKIHRGRNRRENRWHSELCLTLDFILVSCTAYCSNLKIKTCSSETSANFQRNTQCYIPEASVLSLFNNVLHLWREDDLDLC
jgi:hypothetical protein